MVKRAMPSGRRRDRDLDQRLPRAACIAPLPLATSLSVQTPPTSIVTRLQWGDASGICRDAHCAGRRGREAEGGGLLNRYRVVKLYRGFESLRLRHDRHVNDYKRYAQRRDLRHLCSYPSACFEQTAVKRSSALPSEGTRELAGLYLSWWGPVWSSRPNQ